MLFIIQVFILVIMSTKASGQLCTGSLGDPVVNITFGQGSNPGPSLSPGVTNYSFTSTQCPNDGSYSIGTSSLNCFNDSWHSVTEDHTPGDVNGYMMIINASNSPGVFYVDTVRGLCGGTTYEFAAWIMNIIRSSSCNSNSNRPNVTFEIETTTGANLLSYKTGDIQPSSAPQWSQYGAFFKTPNATNTVVIRMTNNAPGGCGNDLLLDDITFRPCGANVVSSFSSAANPIELCLGDNRAVTMTANVTPSDNNTAYQWQRSINNGTSWSDIPGATTTSYTRPPEATTVRSYLYRLAVSQDNDIRVSTCRVVSNVITVAVNPFPVPAASNNGPKCEGDSIILSANDGGTFTWTGPNGYNSTRQSASIFPVKVNSAGKYYVTVVSSKGCVATDSTTVVVNTKVTANAGSDVSICEGSSTLLKGGTGLSYTWSPAAGLSATDIASPVASPGNTTMYTLTVSNGVCTASDSVQVNVLLKPVANAGPDMTTISGKPVTLNGVAAGGNVSWFWTPIVNINNPRNIQPMVTPPNDTTYTLHVVSNIGCGSATDDVFVRVFQALRIPNVFSPNNDGINDVWKIEALETYPDAEVSVFNRYGQLVYRANGAAALWNGTYKGKPLPVATYYYIIDPKNNLEKLSGSLLIIR